MAQYHHFNKLDKETTMANIGILTSRNVYTSSKETLDSLNQKTQKGIIYVEEDTGVLKLGDGVTLYIDLEPMGGQSISPAALTDAKTKIDKTKEDLKDLEDALEALVARVEVLENAA